MFEVIMYDGGVYRSEELFEMIDDVGGVVLQKNRSSQMLMVTMSIPNEDKKIISALCDEIGGTVRDVPLAGSEIAVVGTSLGRHHMPHPICDIAEELRRYGAITVVMGMARGIGKDTAQISMTERDTIDEYDASVFVMGNFRTCIEKKAHLFKDIHTPVILVCGPRPEGIDGSCEAIIPGVGRKASRMRTPQEREKLEEIADTLQSILKSKKQSLDEDPLFVYPTEIKKILEEYEPINMCLRPAPMVLHLDGVRIKIPYLEHENYLKNILIYGRKLGDIAYISPSKIDDSSIIIRIKTKSQVKDEDRHRML